MFFYLRGSSVQITKNEKFPFQAISYIHKQIFSILSLVRPKQQAYKTSNLQFPIFSSIFSSTKQDTTKQLHFFSFISRSSKNKYFSVLGSNKILEIPELQFLPFFHSLTGLTYQKQNSKTK